MAALSWIINVEIKVTSQSVLVNYQKLKVDGKNENEDLVCSIQIAWSRYDYTIVWHCSSKVVNF